MADNTFEEIEALLREDTLCFNKRNDPIIFNSVDFFVAESRMNYAIYQVNLDPHDVDPGNYGLWDKVGRGIENLKSLCVFKICFDDSFDDGEEEPAFDWEILTRVLSHVQNKIQLQTNTRREDMPALTRAIQGHPAITSFNSTGAFLHETFDTMCSALATLPNLNRCIFYYRYYLQLGREDVPTFQRPESVTDLLRAPSLRSMHFLRFRCPRNICEAIAIALRYGSSMTLLSFCECSFPEGGSEIIASALEENSSVTTFAMSLE